MPTRQLVTPALLNGAAAETQWTNLGFWARERAYPAAARELALRVGRAAGLRAGDVVIDYACGHGDSLALWVREFGVARVIGVEADPDAAAAATARVETWGLADRISIRVSRAESFLPAIDAPEATAVVCVDGAYHFADRAGWLRRLATSLTPGTRIGFSDITLTRAAQRLAFLRGMADRAGVPSANLWLTEDIEPTCAAARIAVDRIVRCGSEVLGGFARQALRAAPRWAVRPDIGGLRALGTAVAIGRLRVKEGLGYVIVAARTQQPSAAGG